MEIISPTYDRTRCKSPVFGVPIDAKFAPHIGQCILLWARIDDKFNIVLERLIRYDTTIVYNRSFDKRLKAFKKNCQICLEQHKELEQLFNVLSDDLQRAVISRNLLAHGDLSFFMGGDGPLLMLRGEYKHKAIERSFTYAEIEQLFFDFSHIAGRLFNSF
ncbi:MAG: hypothetical protein DHS20C08_02800 [Rhodomicrobium sp.]|nr:MAG: hypothetical protein DHS20C08_02800 [Rhodomicrobium sp.]